MTIFLTTFWTVFLWLAIAATIVGIPLIAINAWCQLKKKKEINMIINCIRCEAVMEVDIKWKIVEGKRPNIICTKCYEYLKKKEKKRLT